MMDSLMDTLINPLINTQAARSLPRMVRRPARMKPLVPAGRRSEQRHADNRRLSVLVALGCGYALYDLVGLVGLMGFATGCGAVSSATPSVQRYEIDVRVESDPSKPLAAVGIRQGSNELGRTDAAGSARVALAGKNGDVVTLNVACPEGYASPEEPMSITLRLLLDKSVVPQYRAQCQPLMRSLVVAVRAKGGANLAVKHLGREIARTDAEGVAHALLKVSPAEQVTLVLDTSGPEHERLRPKSPEFSLMMPARDDVAVFDQTFSELVPPAVKKKREAPAVLGPVKIEAPSRARL
jgi:hypothetical protein